ncbi:hypothetical protein Rt10032_c11g4639 [Rhodotorula toruloides]|uniref:Tyrosine specific protein phosphatases domain-containing protein n=1 Tax=Rhodotorula toruloides TaxID=5286 RepID=A0A511KJR4_RHOTO|nr:hypothetical protein Rt10032_c11g4639 [Rhodotorula toruloides]
MPTTAAATARPAVQPSATCSPRSSVSSPSKRTYRASPTASPKTGSDAEAVSPRMLRTRLSNVADEVAVELRLKGGRDLDTRSLAQADVDVDSIIPSTPPEAALEALVGLGVAIPGAERLAELDKDDPEAHDGSTQVATAERQMQEYEDMSGGHMHWTFAWMCSQSIYSEYNQLKQALAAAAETPSSIEAGLADHSTPTTLATSSQPVAAAIVCDGLATRKDADDAQAVETDAASASASPAQLARLVSTPAKGASSSSQTALTPSVATSDFASAASSASISTSRIVPASPSRAVTDDAKVVEGLLDDLASGEPVSVQQSELSVVISETIPSVDAGLVTDEPPSIPRLLPGMRVINGVPVKTSVSHPINISPLVPPELVPHLSAQLMRFSLIDEVDEAPFSLQSGHLVRPSAQTDLLTLCATLRTDPFAFPYKQAGAPSLGNFVLSSCPGKKVRMNGELMRNGRGAICRDVVLDLRRARDEYGVGLVVCCIDDCELAYLGVPWEEYYAAARLLGLEIIRIPMVEGFAPDSPESLEVHLNHIVRDYTLRGKSVLAHCRGGIGRAGLVASCWMLKMGLVAGQSALHSSGASEVSFKEEDPMGIVERVIELIRRRRSIKAIETPYQVHFLFQYVAFLQQKHAAAATSASRDAWPS